LVVVVLAVQVVLAQTGLILFLTQQLQLVAVVERLTQEPLVTLVGLAEEAHIQTLEVRQVHLGKEMLEARVLALLIFLQEAVAVQGPQVEPVSR